MNQKRILVLDGHTNQALACVRSLGRGSHDLFVASHQRWPLAGWSRFARQTYRLDSQTRSEYSRLRHWAQDLGVEYVLPLTERSCILCGLERDRWEEAGITVGCGEDDMLLRAFDKALTIQLAGECGVSVPPTRVSQSLEECLEGAAAVGLPCVVKPRFSNAWDGERFLPDRGTAYVSDLAKLRQAVVDARQGSYWPLIQGFVPGQGKGVFALCDRGTVVAWFAHERLRDVRPSGSGSSLRRSTTLTPRLRMPAERLLAVMQWHGPAMVEFRDDGVSPPHLMEVNGRFWGSLQLAIDAGVDFPGLWMALVAGERVDARPGYREGVVVRWLWGDAKRLLHIARGAPAGFPGPYPTFGQGLREVLGPQPPGTRVETWAADDPLPAIGEWVQGLGELLAREHHGPSRRAEVGPQHRACILDHSGCSQAQVIS